jgi:antitoxin (DNA-binding transcriptional repressor) of toxin-antitoxin stability system
MLNFTTHQAKSQLSQLIDFALAGKDVQIYRGSEPMVKLTPIKKTLKPKVKSGYRRILMKSRMK